MAAGARGIPALPGCATWGYTAEEALEALQEAAQAYLEDMVEGGRFQPGWKVARGRHSGSHSHTVTDSARVAFLSRNAPAHFSTGLSMGSLQARGRIPEEVGADDTVVCELNRGIGVRLTCVGGGGRVGG